MPIRLVNVCQNGNSWFWQEWAAKGIPARKYVQILDAKCSFLYNSVIPVQFSLRLHLYTVCNKEKIRNKEADGTGDQSLEHHFCVDTRKISLVLTSFWNSRTNPGWTLLFSPNMACYIHFYFHKLYHRLYCDPSQILEIIISPMPWSIYFVLCSPANSYVKNLSSHR